MSKEQADKINAGDIVVYRGRRCRVSSVQIEGTSAPFFRLIVEGTGASVEDGCLISYRLCGFAQ